MGSPVSKRRRHRVLRDLLDASAVGLLRVDLCHMHILYLYLYLYHTMCATMQRVVFLIQNLVAGVRMSRARRRR